MDRRYYVVQAQVVNETTDAHGQVWTSSTGVPTFFLDIDVQGIVNDEHAEQIARKVVDPLGVAKEVHVSVARV